MRVNISDTIFILFSYQQYFSWRRIYLKCRRLQLDSWVGKIPWRRERLPTPVFLGFPGGSAGKEFACSAGDLGSIPWLGRSPGKELGYPLQYSSLENSIGCIGHGVTKHWTRLSDVHIHIPRSGIAGSLTCQFYFKPFEKTQYCLLQQLHQFIFSPTVSKCSLFSTKCIFATLFIFCLFDKGHSN